MAAVMTLGTWTSLPDTTPENLAALADALNELDCRLITDPADAGSWVLRSAGASATCFNGPSFTTIAANNTQSSGGWSEHVLSGSGSGAGSSQSSTSVMGLGGNGAGPIGPATQSHLVTSGGQPYTFVQGQVVSGVTGVTLVRSDRSDVQATVADGSFVAWWPGSAGATSAQIASSAGVATQQLTFTAPPVRPCKPSSSSTSSCTKEDSGSAGGSAVGGPEGSRVEK